jgi:hypothetical protein
MADGARTGQMLHTLPEYDASFEDEGFWKSFSNGRAMILTAVEFVIEIERQIDSTAYHVARASH